MANCKNHGKKKAVFLANTALIFPYGRGREILCRGAMRLKGGVCKGLHPSARVKKVRNVVSGFFAASARFDPLQTPFRPALSLFPEQNLACRKVLLTKSLTRHKFFCKTCPLWRFFRSVFRRRQRAFFGRGAPKTFGGASAVSLRFLRLPTRIAFRRAALAALFCPLPSHFVSDPLSVSSLFLARPSPPTAGKGGSGAAPYFFPAPPSAGRERKTCRKRERRNLQGKGGVNRRAVKILNTRGGTFAFAKKKVVFSPKGRPTRGNAGKCRKNLFFG